MYQPRLRQRADYTFSHNTTSGRHGWLRLTPAYSVKVVDEILSRHAGGLNVLDPFCGTGTTALQAAYRGHNATTTDINTFLVWLARAKSRTYATQVLEAAQRACSRLVDLLLHRRLTPVDPPCIANIEKWWPAEVIESLCVLKAGIEATSERESAVRALLLTAFCRTLIATSHAAFNHQSMSFRRKADSLFGFDQAAVLDLFRRDVNVVLKGAAENPVGLATIIEADARKLSDEFDARFDLVVTSPPYANRMSYIRELRPYMYWLGFLAAAREAGELDWEAIGGTWGVATSRLVAHKRDACRFREDRLDSIIAEVAKPHNRSGALLANYIAKYMDDMWLHFGTLRRVLRPGAQIHYIVGNSTFYGVTLPVERFYETMLTRLGFTQVACRAIRKRNSKKELFEFEVSGQWV